MNENSYQILIEKLRIHAKHGVFAEERKLGQKCDHGRWRLPDWFSDLSEKADALIQWFGFYHQKIHVLSEMNKTIACTVSKAQEELGYSPEYSLGKGIESSLAEVYN